MKTQTIQNFISQLDAMTRWLDDTEHKGQSTVHLGFANVAGKDMRDSLKAELDNRLLQAQKTHQQMVTDA